MDTIKSMFTPLLKENSMKHIDYKTFNSIQAVANPAVESRYGTLQSKVAELVRKHCYKSAGSRREVTVDHF